MGECGFRGGYCELTNFLPEVKEMLLKLISASLCSSTQVMNSCALNIKLYMVTYEIVGVVDFIKLSTFSLPIRIIFVKSIPKLFSIKYFTTLLL